MKKELALTGIFIIGFGWLYLMGAPPWGAAIGGWVVTMWADLRMGR